jgi:glycosyltransferase involved in cell wall biosynthesis
MDLVAARSVADGYGLPENFFFLPNQFWKHKNHECVVQALRKLKAQGKEVVVAVSGKQMDPRDPDHFPRLQRIIESSGLEKNFRLLGLVPHAHIPALMRSCIALINPSIFEGWSTTVEEAKAMGTRMILSSLRVHREQSPDALFFEPNSPDQLASILESVSSEDQEKRSDRYISAIEQSAYNTRNFANEFVKLLTLTVKKS